MVELGGLYDLTAREGMAATAGSSAPSRFDQAHAALLRQHDLQFEFHAIVQPKPPAWLEALFRALGHGLQAIAPAFTYIFWGVLIIGGAAILFFIAREFSGIRGLARRVRPVKLDAPQSDWRPAAARARTLLRDADALAAEGRFAEAAHLLLFRSIDDIDERWPNTVGPALTSRDIAGHQGLSDIARQTFMVIARVVEGSFFGGAPVGEADFAECRRAYDSFALGAS